MAECFIPYIAESKISESEKFRLQAIHISLFNDIENSGIFYEENGFFLFDKRNYKEAIKFIDEKNKPFNARVISFDRIGDRFFVKVDTLILSKSHLTQSGLQSSEYRRLESGITTRDENLRRIANVNLTKKNIFTVKPIREIDKKAVAKASIATKIIAFGENIPGSSSGEYARQIRKQYEETVIDKLKEFDKKYNTNFDWKNFQTNIFTPLEIFNRFFQKVNFAKNEEEERQQYPKYYGDEGEGLFVKVEKKNNNEWYISGLYLPKFMQNKGVGKDIVDIIKYIAATSKSDKTIEIWSEQSAVGFWEKQGFKKTGEIIKDSDKHLFNKDLEPFVVMKINIKGNQEKTIRDSILNSEIYTPNDVVFVTIPGKRGDLTTRKAEQDKTINLALKAIEQGATLITDNKAYVESSDYNEGEKRLAKVLEERGYNYSETEVDGYTLGVWTKNKNVFNQELSGETLEGTEQFDKALSKKITPERQQAIEETSDSYRNNSLFGLDINNQEKLEFNINTINAVSSFLENAGIEQRLVPQFLSQDGTVVEGALAAANFIDGTVDIIDDLEKGRVEAWNKLPEEAAHWWYRLLEENSPLKRALWEAHETALKANKLYKTQYGKLPNINSPEDLKEEAIGQLIAESIKRIEEKRETKGDRNFWEKFIDWIKSLINRFKKSDTPFDIAAAKILASDMSDLMTVEEYLFLLNQASVEMQQNNISQQILEETGTEVISESPSEYSAYLFKKYKPKTRYLRKTIKKLQHQINSINNAITRPIEDDKLEDFNQVNLTFFSKYELFSKFKNNIPLSSPIKLDTAKQDEILIINHVREKIKSENPGLKTISTEDFIKEVEEYLNTIFNLKEKELSRKHSNYRIDETFTIDNKDVQHIKIGVYLNNEYFPAGHWGESPFAWYSMTPFNKSEDGDYSSVLLHEFQTDFLDTLVKHSTSLGKIAQTKSQIIGSFIIQNDKYFRSIISDILEKKEFSEDIYKKFKHTIDEYSYVYRDTNIKKAKEKLELYVKELNETYSYFRVIENYFRKNKDLLKEFANEYFSVKESDGDLQKNERLNVVRLYANKINQAIKINYNTEIDSFNYLEGAVSGKYNVGHFLSNMTNRSKNKYAVRIIGKKTSDKNNAKLSYFKLLKGKEKYEKIKHLKQSEFQKIYENLSNSFNTLSSLLGFSEDETKEKVEFYKKFTKHYLVPLFHLAIGKARAFKDIRLAGGRATVLTQGNLVTAELYAGPEEVEVDESKKEKWLNESLKEFFDRNKTLNLSFKDFEYLRKPEDSNYKWYRKIYKKIKEDKGIYEAVKIYNKYFELSNKTFMEVGPIYTTFSKTKGIKLIYEPTNGLIGNEKTYKVDLSNYKLDSPILFGLDTSNQESRQSLSSERQQEIEQIFEENPELADIFYESDEFIKEYGINTNVDQNDFKCNT